ncbi:MAG: hypothetical protein IKT27_03615 [Clostridia bacterium]|nr:hypothetical protein [Clostridia bacterium]
MPIDFNHKAIDLNFNTLEFASHIQEDLYSQGKYVVEVTPVIMNPTPAIPGSKEPKCEIHIKDIETRELVCRMWASLGSMNTLLLSANYMDGSKYGVGFFNDTYCPHGYLTRTPVSLLEGAHSFVKYFNRAVEAHSTK